jgi:H+/Cl- antiporter ClcA
MAYNSTNTLWLFLVIGVVFGLLAGLSAFIITLNEWQKHQFRGWKLWKEALSTGAVALAFFLILSLVLGYFFSYLKF